MATCAELPQFGCCDAPTVSIPKIGNYYLTICTDPLGVFDVGLTQQTLSMMQRILSGKPLPTSSGFLRAYRYTLGDSDATEIFHGLYPSVAITEAFPMVDFDGAFDAGSSAIHLERFGSGGLVRLRNKTVLYASRFVYVRPHVFDGTFTSARLPACVYERIRSVDTCVTNRITQPSGQLFGVNETTGTAGWAWRVEQGENQLMFESTGARTETIAQSELTPRADGGISMFHSQFFAYQNEFGSGVGPACCDLSALPP